MILITINMLLDNILYYMAGFIVRSLLDRLSCTSCIFEVLLDPDDCHGLNLFSYPFYTQFAVLKQNHGQIFPSLAVLKIVKSTEVVFQQHVVKQSIGISAEKHLVLKIQMSVLKAIGSNTFDREAAPKFVHASGDQADHLTTLLKMVSKTYSKKYTEMVLLKNKPSKRCLPTKGILFSNL